MKKFLLAIASIVSLIGAGFFSVALGFFASDFQFNDGVLWFILSGLLITTVAVFFVLKILLRARFKDLVILQFFFLICVLSGFFYEHLAVPEGFKLIGLLFILLFFGLFVARKVTKSIAASS
jgi:hypothetical protein